MNIFEYLFCVCVCVCVCVFSFFSRLIIIGRKVDYCCWKEVRLHQSITEAGRENNGSVSIWPIWQHSLPENMSTIQNNNYYYD